MPERAAGWHMSEVTAFDVVVELSNALIARLLASDLSPSLTATEVVAWRNEVHSVDPGDPEAIDELSRRLLDRLEEIS